VLKLCNPNAWKCYFQLTCINVKLVTLRSGNNTIEPVMTSATDVTRASASRGRAPAGAGSIVWFWGKVQLLLLCSSPRNLQAQTQCKKSTSLLLRPDICTVTHVLTFNTISRRSSTRIEVLNRFYCYLSFNINAVIPYV